ncbi:nitrogenase iron-molybdenum cofactor biosynthesis protein NifN [Azotobacter salinestris]|uniref:nitrogenase iron-molybdenum cofactor biosynthesis protein NifN n=1 Tax=Azotobacter salinestris TaxID=69964 RepID=UPI0012668DDA|nr:nitrogenase iron-molybdenum cofactor biosynthesis protein NifN [Azotobacter salinestris]
MARIVQTNKPLSVNPLRVSQPMGAVLAFLGLARSLPLEHGAQGCTAFSKVFFTRHFREPIPLQTTALDMFSSVLGGDERLHEGLATVIDEHRPEVVGLITTGLVEMQGADIRRVLRSFHAGRCETASVVAVNTPDTLGGLESGYALAVEAIIQALVPDAVVPVAQRARQVNLLAGSMLTPADVEAIREWIESFGLQAVILPDLADSLDGHLTPQGYTTLTTGGTSRQAIAAMGRSALTLVIGDSLGRAADLLKARTGIPDLRLSGLTALADCDAFVQALADVSGRPVPARILRQREQLLDALVDSYVPVGGARIAIGADADQLVALGRFLDDIGARLVAAVSPCRSAALETLNVEEVLVGDFEDLEERARTASAQLLIGNSHALQSAERLGIPLLRAGFPQYDHYGAAARLWVGYRGARQLLFELANLFAPRGTGIAPYHSPLRQDFDGAAAPSARSISA